jgi:hypothetical protein
MGVLGARFPRPTPHSAPRRGRVLRVASHRASEPPLVHIQTIQLRAGLRCAWSIRGPRRSVR